MIDFKFAAFLAIVTVVLTTVNSHYVETIVYDDLTCVPYQQERLINNHDTFFVKWLGTRSPSCKLNFAPNDTDEHVCIKVKTFDVIDCDVEVQYYIGNVGDVITEVYSCHDTHIRTLCSDGYENVAIRVQVRADVWQNHNPGSFELKVYTRKRSNAGLVIGLSVGASVLVLVAILITTVVCCARKRRYNKRKGKLQSQKKGYKEYLLHTGHLSIEGGIKKGIINSNYIVDPPISSSKCQNCQSKPPPYELHV